MSFYDKTVLGLGLSFNYGIDSNCIIEFLSSYENFKTKSKFDNLDYSVLKGILLGSILVEMKKGLILPKILFSSLTELRKNNNIIITKSDKGNKIVIMDKNDYLTKMNDLLADRNTYRPIRSNPLKTLQADFNRELKEILLNNDELYSKFKAYLPSLPYMYGLPKCHKQGVPCRPIISTVGSVTYRLSQWLAKHLSSYVGGISHSHIKNSEDFVNKIKNFNLTEKKLVSFDVVSLFTNVPVEDTLQILERYFGRRTDTLPLGRNIFVKLLKLALSQNTFVFNNNYYVQLKGLSMGNPLSPVLANLFMENFEINLLPTILDVSVPW
ncbi:unnamed protein product, partial [Rotaria socialis]